jgi:hypothetical protein
MSRTTVAIVLAAGLGVRAAAAAPIAVEYIPADSVGLAAGEVARITLVNGDGDVAAGDVNGINGGRTCQVEINWGDAAGQPLAPSPATLTLSPGQSAFLDLPFEGAVAAGTLTGRVQVRPLLQARCTGGVYRGAVQGNLTMAPRFIPAIQTLLEVYDAQTFRSVIAIKGSVRVRLAAH